MCQVRGTSLCIILTEPCNGLWGRQGRNHLPLFPNETPNINRNHELPVGAHKWEHRPCDHQRHPLCSGTSVEQRLYESHPPPKWPQTGQVCHGYMATSGWSGSLWGETVLWQPRWEVSLLSKTDLQVHHWSYISILCSSWDDDYQLKKCHNRTLVQRAMSSMSSTVQGPSNDAPNVSFLLNYLIYVFLESFCTPLCFKKNLVFEKVPKKSFSVAESVYSKVSLECL